jgi:electron transfer flavoprotein alpha subunit
VKGELHSTECCGLDLVTLSAADQSYLYNEVAITRKAFIKGHAYIAVTTHKEEKEAKALKRAGFRKVGVWRNSKTRNYLTMWVKNMKRIK